jgi:hypothetical protein
MSQNILIEAFGSIVNEDTRKDNVSLEDALVVGLQELGKFVDFEEVDQVFTGMNSEVTYALEDAVGGIDIPDMTVRAFYPNVNDIMEQDDVEYNEAWKRGYTWRNNQLFIEDTEDDERDTVDLCVRIGDAGSNGSALLQHARTKGVAALDLNIDQVVNRDKAYGSSDQKAAESEQAEA